MSGYLVMAERCNECLYGRKRIVSGRQAADLIGGLNQEDGWFVCHKASDADRNDVRCRGDYETRPDARCDRLARALGLAPQFVREDEL